LGGIINNNLGGIINNYGIITNFGTINSNASSLMANLGTIDNSGSIITNEPGSFISDGIITNTGIINNNSDGGINTGFLGGIWNNGAIANTGTINNNSGGIILNLSGGAITNTGTINNSGGTINNLGTIKNKCSGIFNNSGTFTGNAIVNVPCNQPPVCTSAKPSTAVLWPPNHKMVPITINGVTDPDGDVTTITITSIFQDEPVTGGGSGHTAPDGNGVGTSTADVRAERAGTNDGRTYTISFSADDGRGGTCAGQVLVIVPHDQSHIEINQGALYDSTKP